MEIDKTRRLVCSFVPLAVAAGVLPARALAQPNPYDTLINGQYASPIRLKQVGGRYLGNNFRLTSSADVWSLELGAYDWHTGGRVIPYRGYWIFNPNGMECWQAQGRDGHGPEIGYWNHDRKAAGNPENYEIFNFESVKPQEGTVRIKSASAGSYVRLVGETFKLGGGKNDAAIFVPGFMPDAQVTKFQRRG
jgi:hypothetical protein